MRSVRPLPHGARGPAVNRVALRALRITSGLTQIALGERSGVDATHICRLESGLRIHPSPRVVRALADALDVDMSALLAADLEVA